MSFAKEEKIISKLAKFVPRDYQWPIIDAIENKKYKKILCCLPRRCLSGESHILLFDGSFKLLKDIKEGDRVLSWDGQKFVPDKVKSVWKTGIKQTRIVRSASYLPITTSDNHQFAHMRSQSPYIKWDELINIGRHRSLLQYAGIKSGTVNNIDLAAFWGLMLTDGYVSHYQQPKFTNTNKEILLRLESLATSLFDVNVIWREKGNGYDLGLSNKTRGGGTFKNPVKELFRSEGLDVPKSERWLPQSIWSFDEESILSFFSSVISADGNIYSHTRGFTAADSNHKIPPNVEITISCGQSYYYSWGIYWLLRKIGIVPQVPYKEKGSNWKVKVSKSVAVKRLLALPVYGKREAQEKALKTIELRTKTTKIFRGCFRSNYKFKDGDKEELFDIETDKHHNFVANGYLVHNSGKDLLMWNLLIREALRVPGVYYYCLPTFRQCRLVIFDSITIDGVRFLDYIPKELIIGKPNSQEMKIRVKSGNGGESIINLIGSDTYDTSLVGSNPRFCVFSEYSLSDPASYKYVRPILNANDGIVIIISTPRGKNHFWTLFKIARDNPKSWFCYKLTVDDTKHIPLEKIEDDIARGEMSRELAQQEYWTSFESVGVEGSYYSQYIDRMRFSGQLGTVPWEASHKVITSWDLGMRDSTSIIWAQVIGQQVRIIDYYENNSHGLEHYVKILQDKPYIYGKHIAPHDIKVRELGTGITRFEKARDLGIRFTVADNIPIADGIEAVRSAFSKMWIDDVRCKKLIQAIENYRHEKDRRTNEYKPHPLHDWSSHGADALRMLCVSLPKTRDGMTASDLDKLRSEALYGTDQSNMPAIFRTDLPRH